MRGLAEEVLDSKPLMAVLAVIAILVLVGGLIIPAAWTGRVLTGFVFAVITLLSLFVLYESDVLDLDKGGWLVLLPFPAFFFGLFIEKDYGLSLLSVPLLSLSNEVVFVNLYFRTILLVVVFCLLVVGFSVKRD